jgi:hypothetical protein
VRPPTSTFVSSTVALPDRWVVTTTGNDEFSMSSR